MRHFFTRLFAAMLLVSFSVYLVPNELVHALYGHKDTRETSAAHDHETIGTQHIHCDFLSYEAPVYTVTSLFTCPASSCHAYAFTATEQEHEAIIFSFPPSPRGPPALV